MLEIRERGHESGDKVVFRLADLFHNVVLQIEHCEEPTSEESYDAVLDFLHRRAKEKGCEEWLEQHLRRLEAKSAAG